MLQIIIATIFIISSLVFAMAGIIVLSDDELSSQFSYNGDNEVRLEYRENSQTQTNDSLFERQLSQRHQINHDTGKSYIFSAESGVSLNSIQVRQFNLQSSLMDHLVSLVWVYRLGDVERAPPVVV